jgi:hypothetical protein
LVLPLEMLRAQQQAFPPEYFAGHVAGSLAYFSEVTQL